MMTCCKEKAVLVAVYEEKPKKKRLTRNNHNKTSSIKHHHHHHHHYHHHHLEVHDPKRGGQGSNRKAELLSYSKHLRESSKLEPSTSNHPPKPLVASSTNEGQHTPAVHDPKKKSLKKQPSCLDMNSMFKCFAMSQAKKRMKKRKKRSGDSSSKKTSVVMKTYTKTHKGARRFFKKLMATIQKYR